MNTPEDMLNPPQREAVTHTGGPLLILAGAGSGKTRVISHRIAHLVAECGVPPSAVLAVTFTNKAANEMRERVDELLHERGLPDATPPDIGTFHAICARLLRRYGRRVGLAPSYSIYDDDDQVVMLQGCAESLFLPHDKRSAREFKDEISAWKHEGLGPDEVQEAARTEEEETRAQLYALYTQRMRQANAADFGDLILLVNQLLAADETIRKRLQSRWQHILVDEFQDTNPVQYGLLERLAGPDTQLTVVGDDDQSIYKWRGADARVMIDFTRTFAECRVVKLEQNYRSSQAILDAASDLIAHNRDRLEKRLWTDADGGEPLRVYAARDDREEARFISRRIRSHCLDGGNPWSDVAVFYRVNAQSRLLEEQFRADGIPYHIVGATAFFGRAEIKDLLAWLTVLVNPNDAIAIRRIINTPPRGIGAKTVDSLEAMLESERQTPARAAWTLFDLLTAIGDGRIEFAGRTRTALHDFLALFDDLRALSDEGASPSHILGAVLERTQYVPWLEQKKKEKAHEAHDRVTQLIASLIDYEQTVRQPSLDDYLQRVSLAPKTASDDDEEETPEGSVTLMTIHGAKGLEFDMVFVSGFEDELLPYQRRDEQPDVEEERRLCYVAFTRARKQLYLTLSRWRRLHGNERRAKPSRFLLELARDTIEWLGRGGAKAILEPSGPRRRAPHPSFNAPRQRAALRDDAWDGADFIPDYDSPETHVEDVLEIEIEPQNDGLHYEPDPSVVRNQGLQRGGLTTQAAPTPASDGPLDTGATVTHRRFGIGEVLEREKRADGVVLKVAFQSGTRTIFERFVQPL